MAPLLEFSDKLLSITLTVFIPLVVIGALLGVLAKCGEKKFIAWIRAKRAAKRGCSLSNCATSLTGHLEDGK